MGLKDERPRVVAACWICGGVGNSGEHIAKKSDLKAIFGTVSAQQPLYLNNAAVRNKRVDGLNADALKWSDILCEHCNTTRTQPHDRAWERLSTALRTHLPTLTAGEVVSANTIFNQDAAEAMLAVHLYFVKAFGCLIVKGNLPIDIEPFATAIRREPSASRVLSYVRARTVRPRTGRCDGFRSSSLVPAPGEDLWCRRLGSMT